MGDGRRERQMEPTGVGWISGLEAGTVYVALLKLSGLEQKDDDSQKPGFSSVGQNWLPRRRSVGNCAGPE